MFPRAQLAELVLLDRTAVARIEASDRRIDALELRSRSAALHLPLPHLVTQPPAAIVSRRPAVVEEPDAAGRSTFQLDVRLEEHYRDASLLLELGHLSLPSKLALGTAANQDDARELAGSVRRHLSLGDAPLGPLAEVCERLALLVLVVDVDGDGDGASL